MWTLFLPISQKQHCRHPSHSSWSCHIYQELQTTDNVYLTMMKSGSHHSSDKIVSKVKLHTDETCTQLILILRNN